MLRRHGLATRSKRLSLIAGYAASPEPRRRPEPVRHIVAERPGSLVQLDCFHIGRLSGTKGRVWQYTATDAHSAFLWAELHVTPLNPSAEHTSALVRRVAADLARAGWKLDAVSTDNGSEFKSHLFREAVTALGARHRFIHAGRPQSNGCVEQVQRTVLDECWRPSFARSLVPSTPHYGATSPTTWSCSTTSAPTTAGTPRDGLPPSWSMVRGRCARDDPPNVSGDLGGGAG